MLFISPRLDGIVFADPSKHRELAATLLTREDATELPMSALRKHSSDHPECVIVARIPANPRTGRESAGREVFRGIVGGSAALYPNLSKVLVRARMGVEGRDLLESLDEIKRLRQDGTLTEDQMRAVVDRLLGAKAPAQLT